MQTVQCCEVCGLLAHEGCRGQVAASCRPVAVAAEALPHHWQPAGVVLDESEVSSSLSMCITPGWCSLGGRLMGRWPMIWCPRSLYSTASHVVLQSVSGPEPLCGQVPDDGDITLQDIFQAGTPAQKISICLGCIYQLRPSNTTLRVCCCKPSAFDYLAIISIADACKSEEPQEK